MKSHIAVTQAEHTFTNLLNRVQHQGEEFVGEQGGEPSCTILPVKPLRCTGADLAALPHALPKPNAGVCAVVEEIIMKPLMLPAVPWERGYCVPHRGGHC